MILSILLSCAGDPTEFDLCLDGLEIACECGTSPCLEEVEARRACADYNMRYCDAGGDVYNAGMCRTAQEHQSEENFDYLACFNFVLTAECDPLLAVSTCS